MENKEENINIAPPTSGQVGDILPGGFIKPSLDQVPVAVNTQSVPQTVSFDVVPAPEPVLTPAPDPISAPTPVIEPVLAPEPVAEPTLEPIPVIEPVLAPEPAEELSFDPVVPAPEAAASLELTPEQMTQPVTQSTVTAAPQILAPTPSMSMSDEALSEVATPPPDNGGVVEAPTQEGGRAIVSEHKAKGPNPVLRLLKRPELWLAVTILFVGAGGFLLATSNKTAKHQVSQYGTIDISLQDVISGKKLDMEGVTSVSFNGQVNMNDALVMSPSLQPTGAVAGQIYYDQNTSQLAYYNGTNFVFLDESVAGVTSVGGATGQLILGAGLNMTANQLENSGVLSLQGQTGNVALTAGNGITITGTNIANSGVLSLTSSSSNISVVDNGNGKFTLTGSGIGSVSSTGGTTNTIPMFTGSQEVGNSILTQSGLAMTVGGDLNITGNLGLANALTVANGGTGATTFTANGVLVGNGTGAITSVVAGGSNLCLVSTAGAPTFSACVNSVNGQTGALTIANASAALGTITIDDATTTTKGIASFSPSNFTVTSGAVNTIQGISTIDTPTFAGLNTNNITPSSTLTVGASTQTLILQGGIATTLKAVSGVDSTAITFEAPTATVVYRFATALAGTYDVCTKAGNCIGFGGSVSTTGGTTNRLAKFTGTQAINDSTISDNGTTVTTSVNLVVQGGTVTVGVPSAQTGAVSFAHNGSSLLGTITQSALTGNRTYMLPNLDGVFCMQGDLGCGFALSGSGVTSLNSQTGNLTLANSTALAGTITIDNATTTTKGIASFSATNFTVTSGAVDTAQGISTAATPTFVGVNTNAITPSSTLTVGATTQTLALQGSAATTINAVSGANSTKISFEAPIATVIYRFPTAAGGTYDVCTTTGNCVGVGGGVTTAGGTINRLSKFTSANGIGDSTISDNGTTVSTTVNMTVQGGTLTVGVPSTQTGTVAFASSGSAFTGSITQGALTASRIYTLPDFAGIFCMQGDPACGFASPGGGVTSLNSLAGAVSIANATAAGSTVTIDNATTTTKGIASFSATNFTVTSGAVDTAQGISTAATPTFVGVNTNAITPSATLTIGATGQTLSLQGGPATTLKAVSGASSTTVSFETPTATVIYRFPTAAAGTYDVCTMTGNCVGLGGTVTSPGGTVNRIAKFTAAGAIADSTISDNGTTVTTTGNLVVQGGSITVGVPAVQTGTVNLADAGSAFAGSITQGTLTGNHTYLLPNIDGTFCMQGASGCGFAAATGSANYIQNQSIADQLGSFRISGTAQAGTSTLTPLLDTATAVALNIGTTNATAINLNQNTTIAAAKTLAVTSGATTLTGATSGDALTVSNSTSTGNIAVFKDNTTIVATIADGGAALYKNSVNSTNAFQVQNAAGATSLGVDSTNNRVSVGMATSLADATLSVNGATFTIPSTSGDRATYNYENVASYSVLGSLTGTMKISLPVGWTSTMMRMTIEGFDYFASGDTGAWKVELGGYNYLNTTQWFSTSADITGAAPFSSVRFAYDGSKVVILLGDMSTVWREPKISVTHLTTGFSNATGFGSGWTIGSLANETGITGIVTPLIPMHVAANAAKDIIIGTSDTIGAQLVLDTKTGSGDPTGVNGGMYYNSSTGKFRCYQGGAWMDCVGTAAGFIQNGTSSQTNANFNIQSAAAASVGGVIQGAAGQTANLLEFKNSAGTVLAGVAADGKVGIGIAAPSSLLHLYGAGAELKVADNAAIGSPKISLYQDTTERAYLRYDHTAQTTVLDSDAAIGLNTNNTRAITIDTLQRVGIGTAGALSSTLEVNGTVAVNTLGTANTSTILCRNASNQLATCSSVAATTVPLSGLRAADATNTINNLNFSQTWTWDSATTQNALAISSTTLTSGKGLSVSSSSTGLIGDLVNFTASGNAAGVSGNVLNLSMTGASSTGNTLVLANAGTGLSLLVSTGAIRIGSVTDNVAVSASTHELTLNGTARHAKIATLAAEYPGSVLDASGTNNSGLLTAPFSTAAGFIEGYYNWTTVTVSPAQTYDVVVNFPLPSDWSAWSTTTPITVDTYSTVVGTSTITGYITDTAGTAETAWSAAYNCALTPASNSTWTTKTGCALAGTYTANGIMNMHFRLTAINGSSVCLGTIKLNYLSKY